MRVTEMKRLYIICITPHMSSFVEFKVMHGDRAVPRRLYLVILSRGAWSFRPATMQRFVQTGTVARISSRITHAGLVLACLLWAFDKA